MGVLSMQYYNLSKVTLSVLVAIQLISVDSYAGSGQFVNLKAKAFTEKLLTHDEDALKDPEFQIGEPEVRELSEEEALELAHKSSELEMDSKLISIPVRPLDPVEEIESPELPHTNTVSSVNPSAKKIGGSLAGSVTGAVSLVGQINSVIMVMNNLVALAAQVAPLVEKGKSVVSNSPMNAISVVPIALSKEFVTGEMENWSTPKTKNFEIVFRGTAGNIVAKFGYTVTFQYGGTYKGKGAFLKGVRLLPTTNPTPLLD